MSVIRSHSSASAWSSLCEWPDFTRRAARWVSWPRSCSSRSAGTSGPTPGCSRTKRIFIGRSPADEGRGSRGTGRSRASASGRRGPVGTRFPPRERGCSRTTCERGRPFVPVAGEVGDARVVGECGGTLGQDPLALHRRVARVRADGTAVERRAKKRRRPVDPEPPRDPAHRRLGIAYQLLVGEDEHALAVALGGGDRRVGRRVPEPEGAVRVAVVLGHVPGRRPVPGARIADDRDQRPLGVCGEVAARRSRDPSRGGA